MLQLKDIRKSYTTGGFTQIALDNISLTFRDSEFVAILGKSGSGKTTTLNIIGGLDHYDSGDLVIDGVSTKKYKDRDWDAYRNNRIGFIFQSYNLIPHQTILSNVELALTLSGVSKSEREQRAKEALEQVGLGEHVNKKPYQLSGGQMQRVAIARALINDPEILLADEPTGALDTKTSVQIMDLLTQIAEDRLVIMVTHNPELAEQYANRIVSLEDGHIVDDTNPYEPSDEELSQVSAKPAKSTHMSWLTSLGLSFNNLMTKRGRTLMTAFAGSIGIIGIAAILALANGVNQYIEKTEEETLSEYPLEITDTSIDMTTLLLGGSSSESSSTNNDDKDDTESSDDGKIHVSEIVSSVFGSVDNNDLRSLKAYLDSGESGVEKYTRAIEYSYDVTPQIFAYPQENKEVHQVNPDKTFSSIGLGSSSSSLMSMMTSTDIFYPLPSQSSLYEEQYTVLAGTWPEKDTDCVLVLTDGNYVTDFSLYIMGLRDYTELEEMMRQFSNNEEVVALTGDSEYDFDDILNVKFKLVAAHSFYQYDEEHNIWKDKTKDEEYMAQIVSAGEDMSIVGIVAPVKEDGSGILTSGIYYSSSLTQHIIDEAAESDIVKDQIARPDINVLTGSEFGADESDGTFSLESMFSIDGEAFSSMFSIDAESMEMDFSGIDIDTSTIPLDELDWSDFPLPDVSSFKDLGIDIDEQAVISAIVPIITGYFDTLKATDPITGETTYTPPTSETLSDYLRRPDVSKQIEDGVKKAMNDADISGRISDAMRNYVQSLLSDYIASKLYIAMSSITDSLQDQIGAALASSMSSLFSGIQIDEEALASAFDMDMDEEEISALLVSMMSSGQTDMKTNLASFGYADMEDPSQISIYPTDFENKEKVIEILEAYNDEKEANGEEEKAVSYTDLVGTLMTSVTRIVNMISTVLIAFVSISLVVSSIMIGVITYISVLERKKEIGILRAIGASKRDVSRIFNAETVIEGFISGFLGILITYMVSIPANIIVSSKFDVENIAQLPISSALVLIAISIALSFIAGLLPSHSASKKDPVEALRSE